MLATNGLILQSFSFVPGLIVRVNKLTPCVLREDHFFLVVKISHWGTADSDYNEAWCDLGIDGILSVGKAPIHDIELTANKIN